MNIRLNHRWASALILSLLAVTAHAEFIDGNNWMQKYDSASVVDKSIALGYALGVFDAGASVVHCAPTGLRAGQINDMFAAYLRENPTTRHLSADVLLLDALKKRWPCANSRPGSYNQL